MSATTVTPAAGGPADAAAATARVRQLQALVAQAGQGVSTSSFAAALDAASAARSGNQSTAPPAGATSGAGALPAAISGTGALPTAGTGALPTAATLPVAYTTPAPGAGGSGSGSTPYDATIAQVSARYGLDPALLHGLIQQESGFDPNSRSSAGALGLTQLMPGTASSLGVSNPLDPVQSIEGGARYLSQMLQRFGGNTEDALAAYNAGPGAVSRYGGVPPYAETQDYVAKVLGYANAYRQTLSTAGASPAIPAGATA